MRGPRFIATRRTSVLTAWAFTLVRSGQWRPPGAPQEPLLLSLAPSRQLARAACVLPRDAQAMGVESTHMPYTGSGVVMRRCR